MSADIVWVFLWAIAYGDRSDLSLELSKFQSFWSFQI